MQSYIKNRVKLRELIQFKDYKSVAAVLIPRSFNGFPLYFAQSSFTEIKSTFIKLQNEPSTKAFHKEILKVNNSV